MGKWGGLRSLAGFVMRGRAEAVAAVAGFTLLSLAVPFLSLLSSASLALLALRKGVLESLWVTLASGCIVVFFGVMLIGSFQSALVYCLLLWAPVWSIAILLRETGQMVLAMEACLMLGIVAVLAIYGLVSDPSVFWTESLQSLAKPLMENAQSDVDVEQMKQGLAFFSHYMSGIVVAGSITSLVLALLIARWWQAELFNPGGFRQEFVSLRFHALPTYLGLAALTVSVAAEGLLSEFAWNVDLVFFLLFAVGGFSILHTLLSNKKLWLTIIYIALFFIPHVLLPIALLGLSDVWVNWRRFARTF